VAMLQYVVPLTEALRAYGYDMLVSTENDGPGVIRRMTSSRMVDGLLLLDVVDDDDRIAALDGISQPAVLIGLPTGRDDVDAVDLDFGAAGRVLVDELGDAGHRRVLLITPPEHVFERRG